MKKAVFYICIVAALAFFFDILTILINDFSRLSQHGWGKVTGKIIVFAIFVFLIFFMFNKTYGKKED